MIGTISIRNFTLKTPKNKKEIIETKRTLLKAIVEQNKDLEV